MALVADSFHMLSDIAALLIAFLSGTPTPCLTFWPIFCFKNRNPDPTFYNKWGSGSRLYHHKYSLFLISVIFLIYQQQTCFEGRVAWDDFFGPILSLLIWIHCISRVFFIWLLEVPQRIEKLEEKVLFFPSKKLQEKQTNSPPKKQPCPWSDFFHAGGDPNL